MANHQENTFATGSVKAAIYDRFCRDHIVAFEVANGTGSNAGRFADAIAIGLWPSRGHLVIGMEVKVHRSDWLRELKQPEKAEAFVGYCHEWYVVAPPGIVKPEELPMGWGLMLLKDGALKVTQRSKLPPPKPMPVSRWIAIMRRIDSSASERRVLAASRMVEKMRADAESRARYRIQHIENQAASIVATAESIKETTGIDLLKTWKVTSFQLRVRLAEKIESAAELLLTRQHAIDKLGRALEDFAAIGKDLEAIVKPTEPLTSAGSADAP